MATSGTGGGHTKAGEGGECLYTVQGTPKEGRGGANCQIGQLLTIQASASTIVHEMPLFYKGPGCADPLIGTDEETNGPKASRQPMACIQAGSGRRPSLAARSITCA